MEGLIEEAFRFAIVTEQKSRDLLREAASALPEGEGRLVLERVAAEESAILQELMARCPSPLREVLAAADQAQNPVPAQSAESPERRVTDALVTVLNEKMAAVTQYEAFFRAFREPELCELFYVALRRSRRVLRHMVEQYHQADQKTLRPVVYRRVKRTHIRTFLGTRSAPNEHSQLFISLLDLGRRYPLGPR